MFLIKCMSTACFVLLLAASPVQAGDPPAELTPDSSLDQILQAMQARGEGLKNFTADVSMEDLDNTTGNDPSRTGRIWYDRADDGKVRTRILFDRKILDERVIPEKVEYLLKDGWLTDRNYASKIEINRQVLRPGEQLDLLKLGEGPFPLPIGQDPNEVKRLFEVEKRDPGDNAPPNTIHLHLVPRPNTDMARRFSSMAFWVDLKSHMPVRIVTMDPNMTTVQTTDLTNMQVNQGIADEHFVLEDISRQDWTRRDEPYR